MWRRRRSVVQEEERFRRNQLIGGVVTLIFPNEYCIWSIDLSRLTLGEKDDATIPVVEIETEILKSSTVGGDDSA